MLKFIKTCCFLLMSYAGFSQSSTGSSIWELGGEYQYNFGHNLSQHDLGIRYDGFKGRSNWNIGISYDFGKTTNKTDVLKEYGFGLSVGYRYGFHYNANSNLFGGVRATFEFDHWKDGSGKATSKETVFVPKIEAGYQRTFGTMGHEYATPSIGYGYGIKLNADGNETKADEGSRFIPGISFGYRF